MNSITQNSIVVHADIEPTEIREIEPLKSFPTQALGKVLGDAATTIAEGVKAPLALAAQSVLAVASLLTQQKANVVIDGRTIPLSLFCLTIAESGDRKSSCDKIALKPIHDWQRIEQSRYRIEHEEFELLERQYQSHIKRSFNSRNSEKKDLNEITLKDKPQKPMHPSILCQEPTVKLCKKAF